MDIEFSWRAVRADLALAAVIGLFAFGAMATAEPEVRAVDALSISLVAGGCLALLLRRRAPVTVLFVTSVLVVAYQGAGYPGAGAALPVFCALYTAVQAGHRIVSGVIVSVGLVLGAMSSFVVLDGAVTAAEVVEEHVLMAGWVVAAGVLGEVARQRRAHIAQAEQRANEAERTREEVAQRRAAQERLTIARELHDSLTHNISVIQVQSGVAVHLAHKRGEETNDVLVAIQQASREAMRELRSALEALRPADVDGLPAREAGVARLPALLGLARTTGLEVDLEVTGQPGPLPPATDRAVYRIVQESLTNVTRHSHATSASVELINEDGHMTVRVIDNGNARPGDVIEPGMGIDGMQERAAAIGGWLDAAPQPHGGFAVVAELPLKGDLP